MRKLLRFLLWVKLSDRLPRLPRHYGADFDPKTIAPAERTLMSLSYLRAPGAAKKLERRAGRPLAELADALPVPRWRRRNRIPALLGRSLKLLNYDPFRRYAPRRRRGDRRPYTPEIRRR